MSHEDQRMSMESPRRFALLSVVCLFALGVSSTSADEPEMVEPLSVRTIVADGKHNAFTAMARWKDRYWLAFRKATAASPGQRAAGFPRRCPWASTTWDASSIRVD